ncbi:MAG: AAA family ATPase [Ruminococcaceae bacterium]|nr:AAA family ATPase [Oscillospiraceae bacterium]
MKELKKYLPEGLIYELSRYEYINELRIKRNTYVCIKKDGVSYRLSTYISDRDFEILLDKLLCRSYHSQIGNMVQGYIALGDGYRVGVCGSAVLRDGVITNLSDIISVVIRVPRDIRGLCRPVCEFMQRTNFSQGVLIYSPPGVGKTTLLRDTAYTLASEPYNKRIAIIDSRKELYTGYLKSSSFIDPYIGYPKGKGIELAIRTMAPDIIICDEIGNREETDAILDNQSSGVPIIASAHGSDLSALIMRENMAKLYKSSVFGCYMGISRRSGNGKYRYEIYESEEKRIAT